MNHFAIEHTVK